MSLTVKVINPDEVVYEGQAESILAPGVKGMVGILPGHTPYFGELLQGSVVIEGPEPRTFEIESGLLRVQADEVTILIGI